MTTHRPSGRAGNAFKHGLTSRLATKAQEEEERLLVEALMEGAPSTVAVLEAARVLASAILYLQQVREAKTRAAGMLGRQVRKPRQRKKTRAGWDDGLSDRQLIRLLQEVGAERGLFQKTDLTAPEQARQEHPQPDPERSLEPAQDVGAPTTGKPLDSEVTGDMLRWLLARCETAFSGQKLTLRLRVARGRLESLLDDDVEMKRAKDPADETREVTLEETLESMRRLDDYERRALSRRRKAIRRLDYEILEAWRTDNAA